MTKENVQKEIFKRGSKTYFNSSVFFPRSVREDVFALYSFVRIADDFVDASPQDPEGFYAFRQQYRQALEGGESGNLIIDSFIDLLEKRKFDPQWVEAFFASMEMDLTVKVYPKIEDTLRYIYGSAEVIGLFMANIMRLPEESYHAAKMLGRAMQFINFIRDIDEDNRLGRTYLPLSDSKLHSLEKEHVIEHVGEFSRFIHEQIDLYKLWQQEAEKGFRFIPRRYLIPIKTASNMYKWTAEQICNNPLVVFERKVKPSKARIVLQIVKNSVRKVRKV
jgi:15-cis-phytoene synthase